MIIENQKEFLSLLLLGILWMPTCWPFLFPGEKVKRPAYWIDFGYFTWGNTKRFYSSKRELWRGKIYLGTNFYLVAFTFFPFSEARNGRVIFFFGQQRYTSNFLTFLAWVKWRDAWWIFSSWRNNYLKVLGTNHIWPHPSCGGGTNWCAQCDDIALSSGSFTTYSPYLLFRAICKREQIALVKAELLLHLMGRNHTVVLNVWLLVIGYSGQAGKSKVASSQKNKSTKRCPDPTWKDYSSQWIYLGWGG